jgi:hypothetical protein
MWCLLPRSPFLRRKHAACLLCSDVIAVLAPDTFRDVLHVPDSSFPQSKRVVYRNPRTLHQARSNLELVIDVLEAEAKLRSMTHSGDVGDLLLPLMYLWNGEEVVKVSVSVFVCAVHPMGDVVAIASSFPLEIRCFRRATWMLRGGC